MTNEWKINRFTHQIELIKDEITKKKEEIQLLQAEGSELQNELFNLKKESSHEKR